MTDDSNGNGNGNGNGNDAPPGSPDRPGTGTYGGVDYGTGTSKTGLYTEAELRDPALRAKADRRRAAQARAQAGVSKPFTAEPGKGEPDRPGEARQRMIAAGVMTREGRMKDIRRDYYIDPSTGAARFLEHGKAPPPVTVAPSPEDYTRAFHERKESLMAQERMGWAGEPGKPDMPESREERLSQLERGDIGSLTIQEKALFGIGLFGEAKRIALDVDMPIDYEPSPFISRPQPSATTPEALRIGVPEMIEFPIEKLKEYDIRTSVYLKTLKYPQIHPVRETVAIMEKVDEQLNKYQIDLKVRAPPEKRFDILAFSEGMKIGIAEKPVTTALTAGGFAVLPGILGATKYGVSMIPTFGKYAPKVFGVGMLGVGGVYLAEIKTKILKEKSARERSAKMGEMFGTEILPMGLGGYVGVKYVTPKVFDPMIGLWRTRGMKKQPIEDITFKEVIEGKETFPLIKGKISEERVLADFKGMQYEYKLSGEKQPEYRIHQKVIRKGKLIDTLADIQLKPPDKVLMKGWHVTHEAFPKETLAIPGTRETTGLFMAPAASMYFSRVGSIPKTGYFSLTGGKMVTPVAMRIETSGYGRYPKDVRKAGLKSMQDYLRAEKAFEGGMLVTPETAIMKGIKGRMEYEGIIPTPTQLTTIETGYYTKWKGVRIPIHKTITHGVLKGEPIPKKQHIRKIYDKSQRELYKPPVITPVSLAVSYRPSRVSRMVSELSGISDISIKRLRRKVAFKEPYRAIKEPVISRPQPVRRSGMRSIDSTMRSLENQISRASSRKSVTEKYYPRKVPSRITPPKLVPTIKDIPLPKARRKVTQKKKPITKAHKHQIKNPSAAVDAYMSKMIGMDTFVGQPKKTKKRGKKK